MMLMAELSDCQDSAPAPGTASDRDGLADRHGRRVVVGGIEHPDLPAIATTLRAAGRKPAGCGEVAGLASFPSLARYARKAGRGRRWDRIRAARKASVQRRAVRWTWRSPLKSQRYCRPTFVRVPTGVFALPLMWLFPEDSITEPVPN